MDPKTLQLPPEASARLQRSRAVYHDALRDWVRKGERSVHIRDRDAVRERLPVPTAETAAATASFRLAMLLQVQFAVGLDV